MVGESFHPRGCWGEDSNHIRLGATVQKLLRLFAIVKATHAAQELSKQGKLRSKIIFRRKFLTGSLVLSYTRKVARSSELRTVKETIPMLTSWTYNEHPTKRPATAAMRGVCLSGSLSSPVNFINGRLGQTSIDSRYIRH